MSWRQEQTATLIQVFLLTIAAFLSHLGLGLLNRGSLRAPKPSVGKLVLTLASSLQLTQAVSAPGYISLRPPASTVLPLIYTGTSLDWRLGQGLIYNISSMLSSVTTIIIFPFWEFFTPAFTEFEWQQVSSSLQDLSQFSPRCLCSKSSSNFTNPLELFQVYQLLSVSPLPSCSMFFLNSLARTRCWYIFSRSLILFCGRSGQSTIR